MLYIIYLKRKVLSQTCITLRVSKTKSISLIRLSGRFIHTLHQRRNRTLCFPQNQALTDESLREISRINKKIVSKSPADYSDYANFFTYYRGSVIGEIIREICV